MFTVPVAGLLMLGLLMLGLLMLGLLMLGLVKLTRSSRPAARSVTLGAVQRRLTAWKLSLGPTLRWDAVA